MTSLVTTLGNRKPGERVRSDVTDLSESSLKRRAFLGIAAGGAAAVAVPGIASAAGAADRPAAHPVRHRRERGGRVRRGLDRPRQGPGRPPGPAGRGQLPDRQAAVRPAVRRAAPGGHRLRGERARRVDVPGVRPHVRRAVRRQVRRPQLRRLVGIERAGHRRQQPQDGRRVRHDGHGRRGHQAHRLLPGPGRQGPGRARRVLPDGRHRRAHPRRRHRGDRPGLRPDLRQPGVGADRHGERHGAHRHRPTRTSTATCCGPARAAAAGTSAWSPRSRSAPCPPPSRCSSRCPGRGRRPRGWSPPGSPGRRTRRTRCGRTCTWRRHQAARRRRSRSAAATWAATPTRRTCSTSCTPRPARARRATSSASRSPS